jgi:hypothetical protein
MTILRDGEPQTHPLQSLKMERATTSPAPATLTAIPTASVSATAVVIVCPILLFFSYFTVALRIYTRVYIVGKFGTDDVFILLTVVCILSR